MALLEQVVKIEETTLLAQVVDIKGLKLPMSHPSRVVSENAISYILQQL